jgi:hypothetical protein
MMAESPTNHGMNHDRIFTALNCGMLCQPSTMIILCLIGDSYSKINYTKSKRPFDFLDR